MRSTPDVVAPDLRATAKPPSGCPSGCEGPVMGRSLVPSAPTSKVKVKVDDYNYDYHDDCYYYDYVDDDDYYHHSCS